MRKLTRRQLIFSMIFPIAIFVWQAIRYVLISLAVGFAPTISFQWGYMIAVVVCGVVPIVLTLTLGINSGQYNLPRVLIACFALAFTAIANEMLDSVDSVLLYITFVAITAVYFFKFCPTKLSEWFVIMLASPSFASLVSAGVDFLLSVEDAAFQV